MLFEDKEFEDLVKIFKFVSSNNLFLDRMNSGFKINIKQEKGILDNNKLNFVDVFFIMVGKLYDGGVDLFFLMLLFLVFNFNGIEYVFLL